MIDNIQAYAKAITAILAPIVMSLILRLFMALGIEMTVDVQNAIVLLITGFMVYLIPNVVKK